jgi:FtsP/CotA-like multicopper oxidase with cupredoxin domain
MRAIHTESSAFSTSRFLLLAAASATLLLATAAHAAAPGIKGSASSGTAAAGTFSLVASESYLTQPDGQTVYSWGYGCTGGVNVAGATGSAIFAPAAITTGFCSTMQVPGPTLIVTEGTRVTITLHNGLPTSAGNTSILFPGFAVTATGGVPGLLTQEAAPGFDVTYAFTASSPGTRAYYSGTQADLQVEMGLYGAIVVLPSSPPSNCTAGLPATNPGGNAAAQTFWQETDFRLAAAAYDHPKTCYDREYLFQFSEMDAGIHSRAQAQVQDPKRQAACLGGPNAPGCPLAVATEPYHPAYFMINGRSMPDNMDGNYASQYLHQPYNGNPHMHPGELTLLRIIGQGRWQHPFHEHGNHVRVLARDGNLILSATDSSSLAGPLLFTTTTTPGIAMDGLFYYTARGLNWDMYGHNPGSSDAAANLSCTPDANGYNTGAPTAINYFEWCQDHNKPLQVAPFGDVAAGGPVTLPDPNIFTNGPWYGGSPYLGPDATVRAVGSTGTTPPSGTIANSPSGEAGFAFMWHSHNEREITTNNIFPGGMLMMMLVDSREFVIDESM